MTIIIRIAAYHTHCSCNRNHEGVRYPVKHKIKRILTILLQCPIIKQTPSSELHKDRGSFGRLHQLLSMTSEHLRFLLWLVQPRRMLLMKPWTELWTTTVGYFTVSNRVKEFGLWPHLSSHPKWQSHKTLQWARSFPQWITGSIQVIKTDNIN